VTPCTDCGAQNPETTQLCRQCGAALSLSPPTVSISSEVGEAEVTPRRSESHPPSAGFAPGSLIGDRYRVISLLGRGGMGEVYSADDLKLGQRVALKFLPRDRLKSSSWRQQFYAEVRMARQVSHPNVCRVYDVGESDGRLFLSMELVDGEDLASLLRRIGRLPDDKAVEVAQQLCAGLAAAHQSGVLHRDLKPANVMLDGKGRARITDFGLAVAAEDAASERPVGTPGYMAPELFDGGRPTMQSDVYALGLVLYEVFTGKRAFDAPNIAELHRRQSETDPTPPSNLIRNLDPAVERAILRCLDRDPAQRPRTAQSVAAALPGGDPLAAALAAGETPSPEMVAAAGPQGALRPAVAWTCLVASLVLIMGTSMFLASRATDWGISPMPKSPEVLTDRARDLARKFGYASAVDRADWIDSVRDYAAYAASHRSGKDWKRTAAEQVWPSAVAFGYRQSPVWMTPLAGPSDGPPHVTDTDPPYETSGMVTIKLNMKGDLLFLRAVPPQIETGSTGHEPDWNLFFAEAGLDKSRFSPAPPKWTPPEAFDSRADWEGTILDRPELPLHISAAALHGVPIYFQVIAPWDQPWRSSPSQSGGRGDLSEIMDTAILVGILGVGIFFARWNLRRGRGDVKGAIRLTIFSGALNCAYGVSNYHFAPRPDYFLQQLLMLAIPIIAPFAVGVGYLAVEPFARRSWPSLMVSWQRLLSGRTGDALLGRDIVFGVLAGAIVTSIVMGGNAIAGASEALAVSWGFGQGAWASLGVSLEPLAWAAISAIVWLAVLTIATGVFRKKWIGTVVTGLLMMAENSSPSTVEMVVATVFTIVFMALFLRVGLIAGASFFVVFQTLTSSPPLNFSAWYSGRAAIALLIPSALLIYGFWISLGGQSPFGNALTEEKMR
jgi:hypothetical protein